MLFVSLRDHIDCINNRLEDKKVTLTDTGGTLQQTVYIPNGSLRSIELAAGSRNDVEDLT